MPDLPPAAHQAAGHEGCVAEGPIFAKPSSAQEIDFYSQMAPHAHLHEPASHLSHWMPTFMGLLTPEKGADLPFIVLHNLYHGMSRPCVLDIKLGAVLVDDTVSEEKRLRMARVSSQTTSGLLHFRVCGMKIYSSQSPAAAFPALSDSISEEPVAGGAYYSFDKTFGRRLTADSVVAGIGGFFHGFPHRKWLYTRFHQRLQLLYNCLLDSEVRIKSGLLLFVYDADPLRWKDLDVESYLEADPLLAQDDDDDEDDEDADDEDADDENGESEDGDTTSQPKGPLSRLRFIDFAHAKVTPGQGPDENIIVGVENLLQVFDSLMNG